jgi:hypothetical protein
MVNRDELIRTTEYLTLQTWCRIKQRRYNRVPLYSNIQLHENGSRILHADEQTDRQAQTDRQTDTDTDRQTDRQTDRPRYMTKLTVAFRNFSNVLNEHQLSTILRPEGKTP